ncbi:hypothetical protein V6N12_023393 [Hibiscus sabdariffa]|uniref:Uncharacterized protein n=1 Tax=Hibiscus sabdariffa TaxID=183260 RepID=A0ABR2FXK1_9ROSI
MVLKIHYAVGSKRSYEGNEERQASHDDDFNVKSVLDSMDTNISEDAGGEDGVYFHNLNFTLLHKLRAIPRYSTGETSTL